MDAISKKTIYGGFKMKTYITKKLKEEYVGTKKLDLYRSIF